MRLIITLITFFFTLTSIAQVSDSVKTFSCGTASPTKEQAAAMAASFGQFQKQSKNARVGMASVNIALKIHNVLTTSGYGDISPYVNQILANLNSKFSGITINFYQYGSINYIRSDAYYNLTRNEETALTNSNNVNNAVNIYFVGNANDANGYAYYPQINASDNVNRRNCVFISTGTGKFSTTIVQETIPHEMGHYFNLIHTHEGGDPNNFDSNTREWVTRDQGANCSYAGDQICDTPADPYLFISPTGIEIATRLCSSFFFTQKDPYGWTYKPDISNLMSYYQGCRTNFTYQQFNRMIWGYNLRSQINPDLDKRYYIDGLLRFNYQATQSSFCAGSTINLNFWQFGDFNSGNAFKIQISTNNGVNYSDLSTVRSGKYSLQSSLPSNLGQGNYKLRVVSTSPYVEAGSTDISVLSAPTATISGNAEIFQTQSADLKVQFSGASPWSFRLSDGTQVNNTYSNPHVVKVSPNNTTSYTISNLSNNCGNGSFNGSAAVSVKPLTIITGDVSVTEACVESSLSIPFQVNFPFPSTSAFTVQLSDRDSNNFADVPTQGTTSPLRITIPANLLTGSNYRFRVIAKNPGVIGESGKTFTINAKPTILVNKEEKPGNFILKSNSRTGNQWLFEGKEIADANDSLLIPNKIGNYSVRVSKGGCIVNSGNTVFIGIDKPAITLTGENPFCEGSSTKIKAPEGFGTYKWLQGKDTLTDSNSELLIRDAGIYRISVGRGKIFSAFSDSMQIKTKPIPSKPVISVEGSSLKSNSPVNNQWYLNNSIIKDSTGQYLRGTGSGAYTVRVAENGCFSNSDAFVITGTEPEEANFQIKLYPNPNEGSFWVEVPQSFKSWRVDILDTQGRQIFTKQHKDKSSNKEQIDIGVIMGSYILRVTIGNTSQTVKFVIK